MSKFKKVVLDGRVINYPKGEKVLDKYLKKQGAVSSTVSMQQRLLALKEKYSKDYPAGIMLF